MITYLKGDATKPVGDGAKVIAHIVNNKGGWGRGFVLPLAKRYPLAEQAYREWAAGSKQQNFLYNLGRFELGFVQYVRVEPQVCVANMCAQNGISRKPGEKVVDYDAVHTCLEDVITFAYGNYASVHMPRIGCGLGGATWDEIQEIIENVIQPYWSARRKLHIYVYDLAETS